MQLRSLQIEDIQYLRVQNVDVMQNLLTRILRSLQNYVVIDTPSTSVKQLKQTLEQVRRPCQLYNNEWGDFVANVLIPSNLSEFNQFHEIGNIHALCQTKLHELSFLFPRRCYRWPE